VYSRSGKRLYAISGKNVVVRSFAVVAPLAAPPVGKYVLSKNSLTDSSENGTVTISAYRKGVPIVAVSKIPEVCDTAGLCADAYGADALGTAVDISGIHVPAVDAAWLGEWVKPVKAFVIIK
jgi:hypothetical protein